ncbi:MAG: hypothetical protein ACI4VH_08150 [Clostridia bacterium]
MRSSFMALITCIGSITIMLYIFANYNTFAWWVEPLALVVAGVLTMLVLHIKEILSVGSAGLSMFLLNFKDNIFSNVIHKELSFGENIIITFAIIVVVTIITEILVSSGFTAYNIIFDIILAVLTVAIILWICPLLYESFKISYIDILALPIGLFIYFLLVILINFKANFRHSKVVTESKLYEENISSNSEE